MTAFEETALRMFAAMIEQQIQTNVRLQFLLHFIKKVTKDKEFWLAFDKNMEDFEQASRDIKANVEKAISESRAAQMPPLSLN